METAGFFGEITSTIDWCESNYVYVLAFFSSFRVEICRLLSSSVSRSITRFICEFFNTLSSFAYCIGLTAVFFASRFAIAGLIMWFVYSAVALTGMIQCYLCGLEMRLYFGYLALGITGLGSALFHMTLKFGMQLLDEVSIARNSFCATLLPVTFP